MLLARARVLSSHDPSYLRALGRLTLGRPLEWLPVGNNLAPGAVNLDRSEARSRLGLNDGPIWLGYFGQLDPTRGVEDLLESLRIVRRQHDVRLVMIGSAGRRERYEADPSSAAYLRHLLALPDALGLEDAVRWTEHLSDDEVLRYLRAIDLCVLPYRRNSIGRSALAAALETGVPTVLAGTPAAIAPLRANEHVALVPPQAPQALSAALINLVNDRGERERLADGARVASKLFAWSNVAERAAAIYARACR
jgi:glycosyltransferase involved in cell wall biosynthesis